MLCPSERRTCFEFAFKIWHLVLVALSLLLGDALEIFALLAEGEDLVVRQPGLLLEDVLVYLSQDSPLAGVGLRRLIIFLVRA